MKYEGDASEDRTRGEGKERMAKGREGEEGRKKGRGGNGGCREGKMERGEIRPRETRGRGERKKS